MRIHTTRAAACVLVVVGAALATTPAEPPAPDDPAGLLRGPDVPDQLRQTLVRRNMSGDFVRVEGRPEVAALALLSLDGATLDAALAVAAARHDDLAALLIDEIDLVRELSDAVLAGDREGARLHMDELRAIFEPAAPRDVLYDKLTPVLSDAQATELQRLLDEYWGAWVGAELAPLPEGERDDARPATIDRLSFQLFQEDITRAYDSSLRRYRDAMQAIYGAIQPTDEQREQVRTIVIDHIRATRGNATPDQRRATMRRIYDTLDEERQGLLFDYMLRVALPG